MTPDEARDAFTEAIDGTLGEARQAEFDATLASDDALRGEYEELRAIVRETQALGAATDQADAPALLRGVQDKLRKRSGGRFYRDRFAERAGKGTMTPVVVAVVMLLVVGVVFLALEWTQVVEPRRQTTTATP